MFSKIIKFFFFFCVLCDTLLVVPAKQKIGLMFATRKSVLRCEHMILNVTPGMLDGVEVGTGEVGGYYSVVCASVPPKPRVSQVFYLQYLPS